MSRHRYLALPVLFWLATLFGATLSSGATQRQTPPDWYDLDKLLSPTNQLEIFSTFDHTNANYVRNPNCWAYPIDLTPLSVWSSTMSSGANYSQIGQTLVSPLHFVTCDHAPASVGQVVRWVTTNNRVVSRTVKAVARGVGGSDICVALLDAPITNISFVRFLPSDWADKMKVKVTAPGPYLNSYTWKSVPLLSLNQYKRAFVTQGVALGNGDATLQVRKPNTTNRVYYWYLARGGYPNAPISGGDSGHAVCMVLSNQLVMLTHYHGAASGPNYAFPGHFNAVNTALTTLGGGYQLTTIDWPGDSVPDRYPLTLADPVFFP